ncbi:hypothetical protein GCM10020001_116800 [Nonomuraea salmonea]
MPPLSFVQERLWFLQKFDPDDASYNMYLVLRLRGELDTGALQEALDAVVARHESLRTSFADVDGAPTTVIHPPGPVTVERIDLAGTPGAESEALRLVSDRTNAPFDLAGAPPLRISLLRLGPDDHVLCFVLHHVIADGTSLGILFDDLFALYQDRDAELTPLRIQYGDVALWQREQDSEESLAYWRDQLADPPVLDLPADPPADLPAGLPRGERPEGAFHTFTVPAELVSRLERVAQEHNASLFMVLVAAYQVLLARHTGQDDILVGTPWATRDRMELEPVIGYLTDTLVLRGDLADDPLFADLLDATRRTVLDAHAHRTVPFERLIGELGVPRDLHRNPLLSTMIILHSQAGEGTPPERVGDLGVELFDGGYRQAKFELSLETWRNEQGLLAVFGYDVTRYRADTVEGLAARFETLLQGIADAPETPISRLPLLTADDTAMLTASGSAAPSDGESVPALIRRAVAAHPDATALLWGGETMSYAQLDTKVARLAAALRRRGVAGGCVVGVCLERSAEAVVALLAVWRAGGRVPAAGPRLPGRAARVPDRGQRRPAGGDRRRARVPVAGGDGRARRRGRGRAGRPPLVRRLGPGRAGRSRVRDLHLGIDGPAEGGAGRARQPGGARAVDARVVRDRAGRPGCAVRLAQLRRPRRGALPGADGGRGRAAPARRRRVPARRAAHTGRPAGDRAGPADRLLAPAHRGARRRDLAGAAAAGDPRRRAGARGGGGQVAGAVRRPGAPGQHVRADRGHRHRHGRRPRRGRHRGPPAHRPADRRHDRARPRPVR